MDNDDDDGNKNNDENKMAWEPASATRPGTFES